MTTRTYTFTEEEFDALIDALKKGASRHESYSRFYQNRETKKHKQMARVQRGLIELLNSAW